MGVYWVGCCWGLPVLVLPYKAVGDKAKQPSVYANAKESVCVAGDHFALSTWNLIELEGNQARDIITSVARKSTRKVKQHDSTDRL
ncbi:hypothetical protein J3F83DRAFT_735537, partial [Trichoderma novae-zelandiae]